MKIRRRTRGWSRVLSLQAGGASGIASILFMAVSLTLFLFSALQPGSLLSLREGVTDIVAPVVRAASLPVQTAAEYVRVVSGLADLQEENARLRDENARLREWYQTALGLKAENAALQELLNMTAESQRKYVSARVISDSGSAYFRTLLVDAGSQTGVVKGQAVMGGDGLLGRVIESGQRAARILLVTDMNSRVPVFVESSGERAIASGRNGDVLTLDHLPLDAEVREGDRVLTSGHGGIFPRGVPVGDVLRGEDGRWMVRPYADSTRASFVKIVDTVSDPNLYRQSHN